MNLFRTMCVAVVACGLGACSAIPQRRVMISPHDFSKADVVSQSYPSELRALTLMRRFYTKDPATLEAGARLLKCILELEAAQDALRRRVAPATGACEGAVSGDSGVIDQALAHKRKEWSDLESTISRIVVLAEPPPDSVVTLDASSISIPVSVDGTKTVSLNIPKQVLDRYARSNESDVKRYLVYRLNEALINFPELIGSQYPTLFTAIVNMPVSQSPTDGDHKSDKPVADGG